MNLINDMLISKTISIKGLMYHHHKFVGDDFSFMLEQFRRENHPTIIPHKSFHGQFRKILNQLLKANSFTFNRLEETIFIMCQKDLTHNQREESIQSF